MSEKSSQYSWNHLLPPGNTTSCRSVRRWRHTNESPAVNTLQTAPSPLDSDGLIDVRSATQILKFFPLFSALFVLQMPTGSGFGSKDPRFRLRSPASNIRRLRCSSRQLRSSNCLCGVNVANEVGDLTRIARKTCQTYRTYNSRYQATKRRNRIYR